MSEVEATPEGQPLLPAFEDGKAPDALRTIGEVTRALGIRQHVLRYWEEQFPMLSPVKRSGGRRYYRPEDIALIAEIDRLVHREGFTLRGAKQFLEAGVPARAKAAQPAPSTRPLHEELQSIRNDLAEALAQA
jgi:DNA-binding transcriptional MerR regulator